MAKPQAAGTTNNPSGGPANGVAAGGGAGAAGAGAGAGGGNNKEWDEARVQNALARVQELHAQLRKLRTTVPSLLAPIHAEHTSPETLFDEFRTAATDAVHNVRDFQSSMRESQTKEILEHAKQSKEQTSEGIENWLVSQHGDWLDQTALRSTNDLTSDDTKVKQENGQAAERDEQPTIEQAVQKFKAEHDNVTITLQEQKRNINLLVPGAKITFNITWDASATPQTFKAVAKGNSTMITQLNQFLARRPKADNLPWTLDMLFSYSDIRTRRCDKCNKLLSFHKEFTSVRPGERTGAPNGSQSTNWKAYHPGCAP